MFCLVALCCGLWNGGGGRMVSLLVSLSSLSFFLFIFVLVFGVVRAQLCEHARYPRTPLRLSCCLVFSSLLFVPRFSSCLAFLSFGMAVCVFTMCWCVVLA